MRFIDKNTIQLNNGTKITIPERKRTKLSIKQHNGREKVFLNWKEFKGNEFQVTFASIINRIFY